jgi:hypothetical protein
LDGWTRVINRINYEGVSFNQPSAQYKSGFGSLAGNYWLGLENLRNLVASDTNHVRIELERSFIEYDSFFIDTASNGYQLKIGSKIKGDLYDAFPSKHNGVKFSTYDASILAMIGIVQHGFSRVGGMTLLVMMPIYLAMTRNMEVNGTINQDFIKMPKCI